MLRRRALLKSKRGPLSSSRLEVDLLPDKDFHLFGYRDPGYSSLAIELRLT